MKKSAPDLQLELSSAASVDVPQANSLAMFIRLVEALASEPRSADALASELAVEVRTIHYYLDFGRWLHFISAPGSDSGTGSAVTGATRPTGTEHSLSELGRTFADNRPARARLFASALFARPLVQAIQYKKREHLERGDGELPTLEAAEVVIAQRTALAESTVRRRASALAAMLEHAYHPARVDWHTGEPLAHAPSLAFDFVGKSFLTAVAVRQFGVTRRYEIAFPRQVRVFLEHGGRGLRPANWSRASYEHRSSRAMWFGSIPINESTLRAAERTTSQTSPSTGAPFKHGGHAVRQLVIACAPYVTLSVALLTLCDAARRPVVHMTSDMYGLRLWYRDRELGPPLEVLERCARHLSLEPVDTLPVPARQALSAEEASARKPGTATDLVEVLLTLDIVRRRDTRFELAPGILDELREADDALPSLSERLAPLQTELIDLLRRW